MIFATFAGFVEAVIHFIRISTLATDSTLLPISKLLYDVIRAATILTTFPYELHSRFGRRELVHRFVIERLCNFLLLDFDMSSA